jgi:negative regulator of genetic competence, sporulation and motility
MESEVMEDLMDKLVEKLKGDIKNHEIEIEEMKKVLQFYAEPATYDIRNLSDHGYIIIDKDNGERARKALNKEEW